MALDAPTTRALRQEPPSGYPPALKRAALSLSAVLATLLMGQLALHRIDVPVRELAVSGALRHVRADEVRAASASVIDGHLFDVDLKAVRAAVERLPWVAHARVDRQWPARLMVRVWERDVFARWSESDALSTEGVVFEPGDAVLADTLPRLVGAPGREREVMVMYQQLADRLSETPFMLAGLALDARGDWLATTHTGLKLHFGRNSPLEQIGRLKTVVLPTLLARLDDVQYIDLRYLNGFAVGWQPGKSAANPGASPTTSPSSNPTISAPASEPVAAPKFPGVTP